MGELGEPGDAGGLPTGGAADPLGGGATHWVQTVEIEVDVIVEIVLVTWPLLVTGQVVTVVTTLRFGLDKSGIKQRTGTYTAVVTTACVVPGGAGTVGWMGEFCD